MNQILCNKINEKFNNNKKKRKTLKIQFFRINTINFRNSYYLFTECTD